MLILRLTLLAVVCGYPASVRSDLPAVGLVRKGGDADWLPANKTGFGTSHTTASNVWFTLQNGRLSEVYYPRIDTPSVRNLDFIVTDGQSFATRAQDASVSSTRLVNPGNPDDQKQSDPDTSTNSPQSLSYQIVNRDRARRWRLTTTFVTDPSRPTLLIDIEFTSLNGKPYQLYAVYQPQLNNPLVAAALDDSGQTKDKALITADQKGQVFSALVAAPDFAETANGYLGTTDGGTDLAQHYQLTSHDDSALNGTVVQTGRLPLTGLKASQHATLALGFGSPASKALSIANDSLAAGFARAFKDYADGWNKYLQSLHSAPPSLSRRQERELYAVSAMVLAACEDKIYRGAFIASPSIPWAFGNGLINPSGPYHGVWPRDQYEIATALIADGDLEGATRALDYILNVQQTADGSCPQNTMVDGTPIFHSLQLDEVSDPIILAYQLGRTDAGTWLHHIKPAAEFIMNYAPFAEHRAPYTLQERWEEQSGYSPACIASEVAALVCAADIARANNDPDCAKRYLATADSWRSQIEKWTVTTNGPYSSSPYYLRLTKDGRPNAGTTYQLGNGGPGAIDQRKVVDPSFLELVRLGIETASDPVIVNSLKVVDTQLSVTTSAGKFWHRYTSDGYGETATGAPWTVTPPDSGTTHGRVWSIFAGERGEYEIAARNLNAAQADLVAIANTANEGDLLPEQVWDNQPPAGQLGFVAGAGTTSATPLAWTHAQFIRLAFDLSAGRLLEQPSIVAERYLLRK
ncbi:MAG: glucoamylase [Verrucomicrobia bacterium]|nr:glucoamylase [Verrucomicrobiota bacterium]MBV8483733.1 glucoamylase [Verrucomicrobiota bacterium]